MPYLVIEGMIVAGLVTGACRGYVYIRHEYAEETEALREALAEAEKQTLCGTNVLGTECHFPIEVFVSPGGYILGEESALLEAMEDRRGEPRYKPPYPVSQGLFGKPTLINNVETLAWVPAILHHGGEWYRDSGVHGAAGLRLVSVSGDVSRPGVYEVPLGQAIRDLIYQTAGGMREGQSLRAVAPSGPSGGFLPAAIPRDNLPAGFVERMSKEGRLPANAPSFDILDLPLDYDIAAALGSMLGGGFIVLGDRADLLQAALNFTEFFRNESCGKCVPCRLGSQRLVEIISALSQRRLDQPGLDAIHEIAEAMTLTSICGLGMVASNPITSLLKYFPEKTA